MIPASGPLQSAARRWNAGRAVRAAIRSLRRTDAGPSLGQLAREYLRLRGPTGASPREFLRYRLWDTRTPLADRLSFLTWATRRPLEDCLNLPADAMQIRSKVQGEELFRSRGLPQPRRLGTWCPDGVASTAADAIRSPSELAQLVDRCPDGLVFKRDVGGGGDFVLVFVAAGWGTLVHASGVEWTLDRLDRVMAGSHPWLIQARLTSHPSLAAITGTSYAATLRIVTCRRRSGRIFMLPATLKLPATDEGIDNFGAGNVAIAIDELGRLGAAALGLDGPAIDAHPVTHAPFATHVVPHWEAALAAVHVGQELLPTVRSVGWDVAITADGPVILEANAWWGVDVIQQPGLRGLLRGEFVDFVTETGGARAVRLVERQRALARG